MGRAWRATSFLFLFVCGLSVVCPCASVCLSLWICPTQLHSGRVHPAVTQGVLQEADPGTVPAAVPTPGFSLSASAPYSKDLPVCVH